MPFRVSQATVGYPDKRFETFHAAATFAAKRAKNYGWATVFKGQTPLLWCGSAQPAGSGVWDKRYAKCTLSTVGRRYLKAARA